MWNVARVLEPPFDLRFSDDYTEQYIFITLHHTKIRYKRKKTFPPPKYKNIFSPN